jgi:hypothetical protein
MRLTLLFAALLCAYHVPALAVEHTRAPFDDSAVQDTTVNNKVLTAVSTHILKLTKNRTMPLVVKDGTKKRRFIVRDFLDSVSVKKNVYTAQVDVDEYDHKIPRILFVDVRLSKGAYKVGTIRIGPNHWRKE